MTKRKVTTYYVADFETTPYAQYLKEGRTRVYLFYIEALHNDADHCLGINLGEFTRFISQPNVDKKVIFFHNLSYDILFFEYFLNEQGVRYDEDSKKVGTYHIVRDEFMNVYQLTWRLKNGLVLEFRDSYKLLMSSVARLPNLRNLEKLEGFDYEKIRTEKKLSDFSAFDIEYVKHDVWKVKDVLVALLPEIGDHLTIASSSYMTYKHMIYSKYGKYQFQEWFPPIDRNDDMVLRKAFNGGIVLLNPKYARKTLKKPIITYDKNSMYPDVMRHQPLPIGVPLKIINKEYYDILVNNGIRLFVFVVDVRSMTIKDGYHPFIQKHKNYTFGSGKQQTPRHIENQIFYWTSIDLEMVTRFYDIDYSIIYDLSYGFQHMHGLFDDYVDQWYGVKQNAANEFERMLAKLRLNSVFGKFGTRAERYGYETGVGENGRLTFSTIETRVKSDYYLPIAIFITSWARASLVEVIEAEREAFIYADTDSVHLFKDKAKLQFEIDGYKLGAWKYEGESTKTIFYANKQYIKLIDGKIKHTIASLNKDNHTLVNFENMQPGSVIKDGKKMKEHVYGGYVITKHDFTFTDYELDLDGLTDDDTEDLIHG